MAQIKSLETGIKFKDTPIGKIPVDWSVTALGSIASLEYGASLPEKERIEGTIPVYGSNGAVGYHNKKLVSGPGIIIGRKGTVGAVTWAANDFWAIDTTYFLSKEQCKEPLNLRWLFYLLSNLHLEKLNAATGIPGINRGEVCSLTIALPALPEQNKIAEILSTVDDAIEETDEILEKTKELRKGLMQKLLTRGLGHKKFKKTEIGEIPEEWKVCTVEDVAAKEKNAIKSGPFGSELKKSIFVRSGYKVYGQEQVIPDNFSVGNYYISEETFNRLKDFEIRPGDILISLVGTFGKISVVPDNAEKGIINPRLIKITLDKEKAFPLFVKFLLTSPQTQRQMLNYTHGLTMGILNTKTVKSLVLPIPPLNEQVKITNVLLGIDAEMMIELNRRNRLQTLKKSLMQVLLTGKVRVKLH